MRDDGTHGCRRCRSLTVRTYKAAVTAAGARTADGDPDDHVRRPWAAEPEDRDRAVPVRRPDGRRRDAGGDRVRHQVPEAARAAVQKRLFVDDQPAPAGRVALGQRPAGLVPRAQVLAARHHDHRAGGSDWRADGRRHATATPTGGPPQVGNKVSWRSTTRTKQMQVYVDDQLVRTDAGEPRQAEHAVVERLHGAHDKEPTRTFDTRNEPTAGTSWTSTGRCA